MKTFRRSGIPSSGLPVIRQLGSICNLNELIHSLFGTEGSARELLRCFRVSYSLAWLSDPAEHCPPFVVMPKLLPKSIWSAQGTGPARRWTAHSVPKHEVPNRTRPWWITPEASTARRKREERTATALSSRLRR